MRGRHSQKPQYDISALIGAAAALILILVLTLCNLPLWAGQLGALLQREISFPEFRDTVTELLTSDDLWQKNSFITLKGAFDRWTQRRLSNEVLLLNNGMETTIQEEPEDMTQQARDLTALADYLAEEGIDFLYVQAPGKLDTAKTLLPEGKECYYDQAADDLLAMTGESVEVLDLRPSFCATVELVEQSFYNTDHHWNTEASFRAFGMITERMNEMLGGGLDLSYTDRSLWQAEKTTGHYLGSHGRRVGAGYGGWDEFILLTPAFETDMSFINVKKELCLSGDFREACVFEEWLSGDPFTNDCYNAYTGGSYAIQQLRNRNAPNPQKVLVIKDSYGRPIVPFLATLFAEVDSIDPRRLTEQNYADYIAAFQPDIVVMIMTRACILNTNMFTSGVYGTAENARTAQEPVTLLAEDTLVLEAGSNNYSSLTLQEGLIPGARYTLHINHITFDKGGSEFVSTALALTSDNSRKRQFWDLAYGNEHGGFTAEFTLPADCSAEESAGILIYAGLSGSTAGNSMTLSGVTLTCTQSGSGYTAVYATALDLDPLEASYRGYNVPYEFSGGTGAVYQLTMKGLQLTAGGADSLTVALQDAASKTIASAVVPISGDQSVAVTVPETAGAKYHFRIFAGIAGSTEGIGIHADRVIVSRVTDPAGETLWSADEAALTEAETALPAALTPGAVYTLAVDSLRKEIGSSASRVEVMLCDPASGTSLGSTTWWLSNAAPWTFTVPKDMDACELRLVPDGPEVTALGLRLSSSTLVSDLRLLTTESTIALSARDESYQRYTVPVDLLPGASYRLTIRDAWTTAGRTDALSIRLYDSRRDQCAEEKLWYINGNKYSLYWEFTVPEDAVGTRDYTLLLYSGEAGKTNGIGVTYKDLVVTRIS